MKKLLKRKWFYLLITLIFSLLIAFLFNDYSKPVYEVKGLFLMEDDFLNSDNFMGFPVSSGIQMASNKKKWMQSFTVAKKTVETLGWEVFYYHRNHFVQHQIKRRSSPFRVVFDTLSEQITGNHFEVMVRDSTTYHIKIDAENFTTYHYGRGETINNDDETLAIDTVLRFGEKLETDFCSFRLAYTGGLFNHKDPGVYKFQFNDFNVLADRFRWVRIKPQGEEATLMKVYAQGMNPSFKIEYLNALMQYTLSKEVEQKSRSLALSVGFLEQQIHSVGDSLEVAKQTLTKYQTKHPKARFEKLAEQDIMRMNELLEFIADNDLKLRQVEHIRKNIRSDSLNKFFKSIQSTTISGQHLIDRHLLNQLTQLYSKRQNLAIAMKRPTTHDRNLTHQIRSLKRQIVEQLSFVKQTLMNKRQELNNQLKALLSDMADYPGIEQKGLKLLRDYKILNHFYTHLMKRSLDLKLSKASVSPDSQIVDKASQITMEKVYPKEWLNFLIAILLGLGIPIGYFYLHIQADNKVKSTSELNRRLKNTEVLGRMFHNDKDTTLVTSRYPLSRITESVRAIRAKTDFILGKKPGQVILITSVLPGEGKTFVSINMSLAYALKRKKTILLGFDLRKPRIYKDFNVNNMRGLSNYLANQYNWPELVQSGEGSDVDLLMAGPVPPNPAELMNSEKTGMLMEELKQIYDYIIIDTPPVGLVTDAQLLAKHADMQLFVARQNYTDEKKFAETINALTDTQQLQRGYVVLNDAIADKEEGYGYYSEDYEQQKPSFWQRLYHQ